MSRQDKAVTERFTKTLRELVKRPENKLCADCKRNDPRWASWNLGVFLCIRCSGIHRGMGTHISKVKSVDLDTWTPEQMESIQKWGNRRANLYWESHLKPGHIPPDHKMESFIRSKYESRRWAMDGPPPTDPSVLDGMSSSSPEDIPVQQAPPVPTLSRPTHAPSNSRQIAPPPSLTTRQPQPHQLLSSAHNTQHSRSMSSPRVSAPQPAPVAPVVAPAPPKAPENDLFTLDFHAPTQTSPPIGSSSQLPKKDVKQDILSLFSTPAPAPAPSAFGQFGGVQPQQSPWGQYNSASSQPQQQQQQPVQPTSMMGANGTGVWGANSGWNSAAAAQPAQGNLWGNSASPPLQQQQQPGIFSSSDVWGAPTGTAPGGSSDLFSTPFASAAPAKKEDVFGDLWGGFK